MADREVIHERAGSSIVSWVAIVLSVIAIVLSWIAYNRTGEDLESKINQQLQEAQESVENQVDNETPNINR